jgi:hypothetical protein
MYRLRQRAAAGFRVNGALEGLRVLDITPVMAGSYCGMLLDLGADVVKVERPGIGDLTRWAGDGVDAFEPLNRNKRGIAVDFAQPAGADLIRRLADRVDVVVENHRPGALATTRRCSPTGWSKRVRRDVASGTPSSCSALRWPCTETPRPSVSTAGRCCARQDSTTLRSTTSSSPVCSTRYRAMTAPHADPIHEPPDPSAPGGPVRVEAPSAHVRVITIDRPPVNAIDMVTQRLLNDAVRSVDGDGEVRAVVLTGAGRAFCAGADLREEQLLERGRVGDLMGEIGRLLLAVRNLRCPVIAAVDGAASGGGLELALGSRSRRTRRVERSRSRATSLVRCVTLLCCSMCSPVRSQVTHPACRHRWLARSRRCSIRRPDACGSDSWSTRLDA